MNNAKRPMGLPTRFAFWFLPRMTMEFYEAMMKAWWIVLLLTISPSLFLMRFFGADMLWIFGGAMLAATLAPVVAILAASWAEIRVRDQKNDNPA